MSKVRVFIQFQLVIIVSAPSLKKISRGRRLTKNESFTAALTSERAQFVGRGMGEKVEKTGSAKRRKIVAKLVVISTEGVCISFYLDLHQEFMVPKTIG